ncbi:MAG TPA: TadE/TadG family type IV pilus assembly protein [Dongiaceae bacterium]|nr:TadE/TadG family type IV pilus assembly protein [Dongiaceae bacterium]
MKQYRTKGQDSQSGQPTLVRGGRFSLRRLWRDDAGTTAIEFAFIALGVVYLMVGIIEFAMAMTVGNSLEAATNLSSRLGKTGYVDEEAQLSQEQTIMDEVERRVGPMIDMEKVVVTHEVFNDFTSLNNPDVLQDQNADGDTDDPGEWTDVDGDGFKDGADGVGGSGNVVVYRISYPWEIMTPLIAQFVSNDGIIDLTAYSVVKNEPY